MLTRDDQQANDFTRMVSGTHTRSQRVTQLIWPSECVDLTASELEIRMRGWLPRPSCKKICGQVVDGRASSCLNAGHQIKDSQKQKRLASGLILPAQHPEFVQHAPGPKSWR